MNLRRRLLLGGSLAAPFIRPARADATTITLAAYSGIFQDNYVATVVEPFERANPDIKVQYYPAGSSASTLGTLRAQKAAPQIDVVIIDASVAKAGSDEGLFEKPDPAKLPVLAELSPRAHIPGVDAPAVTFDNFVLLYSPQRVQPAPTSWKVFWDEKYKDQIAFAAAPDIVGLAFTIMANKTWGGANYLKLDTGIAKIAEMAAGVLTFEPKPDNYTMIIAGQIALGCGWNARGQIYAARSEGKLAVALPDEGSLFQINVIGQPKGIKNPEAAQRFIAHALSAPAQKAFTERMFYAPVNSKAQISPEAAAKTASTPDRQARMLDVDWLEVAKIRDNVTEQWRRRILSRR
jgi:putative spermidine/putrescine transport system substrate-binding protein